MCRLSPYEGIQRRTFIVHRDDIEDAVLPMLEQADVTRLGRRRNMRDPQVIAGHVVDANRSSEQIWNRARWLVQ